jgi:hypothetical protein
MKRYVLAIVAFVLGALLASAGWAFYNFKKQTELSIYYVTMLHGFTTVSEDFLVFLERPYEALARRLAFASSNSIALFPSDIEAWDKEYPYVRFSHRYSSECQRLQRFMADRQARF